MLTLSLKKNESIIICTSKVNATTSISAVSSQQAQWCWCTTRN